MNETTNMKDKSMTHQNGAAESLKERVEHARDVVESIRDKAELAIREKPYLLPVATGVGGLAIGLLLGSKITRFILFTAVGTLLSDALGGEVKRISRDFMENLQERLGSAGEGEAEPAE